MLLGGLELLIIPALKGLLIGAAVGAVIYVALLTFDYIRDWFLENKNVLSEADTERVAFSVKHALDSGQVVYKQGFFDTSTEQVVKARIIQPDDVAADVAAEHPDGKVVIYQ